MIILDWPTIPALKQTVIEAVVKATRIGGTGSRLLSGHAAVWNELEEEFAAFAGSEAALYFGSGYAANIGLLTSLANKNDVIFSDDLNHASIIDGIRLSGARKVIYPHRDLNASGIVAERKSVDAGTQADRHRNGLQHGRRRRPARRHRRSGREARRQRDRR